MGFLGTETGFRVVLKRNCSISPAALMKVYSLIALVSIGIGIGFAAAGAWMVLPFAGLEVAALGAAFLLNGRHAGDYERIELEGSGLTVEVVSAGRVARARMDPRRVRVGTGRGELVMLSDSAMTLEVGRHLGADARAGFGAELAARLQQRIGR